MAIHEQIAQLHAKSSWLQQQKAEWIAELTQKTVSREIHWQATAPDGIAFPLQDHAYHYVATLGSGNKLRLKFKLEIDFKGAQTLGDAELAYLTSTSADWEVYIIYVRKEHAGLIISDGDETFLSPDVEKRLRDKNGAKNFLTLVNAVISA